jgi:Protein of unknown function (DUF732)
LPVNANRLAAVVAAAVVAAAVFSAAPAQADDASYMADLRAHGAPIFPGMDSNWISQGHRLCNELRMGVSRANVAAEVTQWDAGTYMDILQHDMCPDTLGK